MRQHENIKASVSKDLAAAAREAVTSGDYATTSEVVQDALKLWKNRREIYRKDTAVLRGRFEKGIASGDAGLLDIPSMIIQERQKNGNGEPFRNQNDKTCGSGAALDLAHSIRRQSHRCR